MGENFSFLFFRFFSNIDMSFFVKNQLLFLLFYTMMIISVLRNVIFLEKPIAFFAFPINSTIK